MIGIVLAIALLQSPPSRTVPLVFDNGNRIVIVTERRAERLRRSRDPKVRAAVELALMVQSHNCPFTPKDAAEIERCRLAVR